MKKRYLHRFILYNLVIFLAFFCAVSCINKENEFDDFIFDTEYAKSDTIDFNLMNCLNESNKKIIQLSSIAFNQKRDAKTLQLLLKIKSDHQIMDTQLKNLVEKNLIILPKLVYDFHLIPDSLKENNANSGLLKALEKEIKNQVVVLDRIEKKSQNIDFRTFSVISKKRLQTHLDDLQTILNTK